MDTTGTRERLKQERLKVFDKRAQSSDLGEKEIEKMRSKLEAELDSAATLVDNRRGVTEKDDFDRLTDQASFEKFRREATSKGVMHYPSMDEIDPRDDLKVDDEDDKEESRSWWDEEDEK